MPQHEQTVSLQGMEPENAMALALQTFQQLQWPALLAMEKILVANTPRNWKTYGQQIVVTIDNGQLTVKSEMVNGESLDLGKRNSKNVGAFLQAWQQQLGQQPADLGAQQQALNDLRQQTVQALQQEEQEAAEVDAAMNLSRSNLYVTYGIIAINVVIFILMAINGAGLFEPNGLVHLQWGSNFGPFTLSGDWWRLITCTFLHFGVIHLAMNMYSLYMAGIYLEPMLGKAKYIAAYLATGVVASVASLWWHSEPTNSAGASGAVFGIYGVFLALLTTNLIPKKVRQALLGSIGIFVLYNLFYGLKGGVDNAAHIGGLLSGLAIGYIYAFGIKKEKEGREPMHWISAAVAVAACVVAFLYLQQNKVSGEERRAVKAQITNEGYKDYNAFNEKLGQFDDLQKEINALLNDDSLIETSKRQKITDTIIPLWDKSAQLLQSAKALKISPASQSKADKLIQYVDIKKKLMQALVEMIDKGGQETILERSKVLRDSANRVFEEAVAL
jgi:rhomboid protease GluP